VLKKNYYNKVIKHFTERPYDHDAWLTHELSSENLIKKLNALKPSLIIDAGCGSNPYKGHVPNVIGFDPSPYDNVDLRLSFEEVARKNIFGRNSADAVLALGSINFGDKKTIRDQLKSCISWCKPGGYIICRARPHTLPDGLRQDENELVDKGFNSFPWTHEIILGLHDEFKAHVDMYKKPKDEMAHSPWWMYKTRQEALNNKFPLTIVWWWRKKND